MKSFEPGPDFRKVKLGDLKHVGKSTYDILKPWQFTGPWNALMFFITLPAVVAILIALVLKYADFLDTKGQNYVVTALGVGVVIFFSWIGIKKLILKR